MKTKHGIFRHVKTKRVADFAGWLKGFDYHTYIMRLHTLQASGWVAIEDIN